MSVPGHRLAFQEGLARGRMPQASLRSGRQARAQMESQARQRAGRGPEPLAKRPNVPWLGGQGSVLSRPPPPPPPALTPGPARGTVLQPCQAAGSRGGAPGPLGPWA